MAHVKPRLPLSERDLDAFRIDAEFREEATIQYGGYQKDGSKATQTWESARSLGKGTFGRVRQERLRDANGDLQYRAVKICSKDHLRLRRGDYTREISALAALSSSKVTEHFLRYEHARLTLLEHYGLFVNLMGWWTDSRNLYIAMEYIPKGDLSAYIREGLTETAMQEIMSDILNGLLIMHQQGFTHRDLKPQNILVVQKRPEFYKWHVKIADFGVSKRILEDSNSGLHTSFGTRPYCAPEILGYLSQTDNSYGYTSKVDIWSLGCVLFAMSTCGHIPFAEADLVRYCDGHLEFNPQERPIPLVAQGVALLKAMLNVSPTARPTVLEALNHAWFAVHSDLGARPVDQPESGKSLITSFVPRKSQPNQRQNYNSFLQTTDPGVHNGISNNEYHASSPSSSAHLQQSLETKNVANEVRGNLGVSRSESKVADIKIPKEAHSTIDVYAHHPQNDIKSSKSVVNKSTKTDFRKPLHEIKKPMGHAINAVAFSPDGNVIAYCTFSLLWIREIWSGKWQSIKAHTGYIRAIEFSSDGLFLVSASDDRGAKLWDIKYGTHFSNGQYCRAPVQEYIGHSRPIRAATFSPDGNVLATASEDRTVILWDTLTASRQHTFAQHDGSVSAVKFSPDNKLLASASFDRSVRLWDLRTAQLIRTIEAHDKPVRSIAFSPDGQMLASGSSDRKLKLWETSTGKLKALTTNLTDYVNAVAFSPNGECVVATGSEDAKVRIWTPLEGASLLHTLIGHAEGISSLAYSPSGRFIVSGSMDGAVRLWEVEDVG